MTASGKSVTRLLPVLALLAVLPFSILSCTKAGDEPEGPTGPGSQYNPELDTPGAKIAVDVDRNVSPGVKFALAAAFTDGDGRPVPGVPLTVQVETGTGNVVGYFQFEANPNITDAQGRISTHLTPAADCPNGSYTIVVFSAPGGDGPVNGPHARGYGGIYVGGAGVAAVTQVTLTTSTPVVVMPGNAVFQVDVVNTSTCTPQITFQAAGAGLAVPAGTAGSALIDLTPTAPGTLVVIAAAYCTETPTQKVYSDPVSVTVNPAP